MVVIKHCIKVGYKFSKSTVFDDDKKIAAKLSLDNATTTSCTVKLVALETRPGVLGLGMKETHARNIPTQNNVEQVLLWVHFIGNR